MLFFDFNKDFAPAMFSPSATDYCDFDPAEPPRLTVCIDTEEEFDWSEDFSRENTQVSAMAHIGRVQSIFDEFGIKPVYVIDYPVATTASSVDVLGEIHRDGRCVIGAHLHPWVSPPHREAVNRTNSFPGNLQASLEAEKLETLCGVIDENFGHRPTIYKAGRYGIGPNTAAMLEEQGFEIDMSVCPNIDLSAENGPDFTASKLSPYWFGHEKKL
ncbi:MAG: glycosyltransferase, partial [Pseudomonadota bacterium]